MIDELDKKDIGLAYVYFSYQDQDHQSPTNVIASILRQLAVRMDELVPEIYALHKKLHARGSRPDLSKLVDCIISSATAFSSTYVIIDAIDASDKSQRPELLKAIHQLSDGSIKVFVTGRPNLQDVNEFIQNISNIVSIPIYADIDDLKNYIKREICQRNLSKTIEDKLTDKLSIQADGV